MHRDSLLADTDCGCRLPAMVLDSGVCTGCGAVVSPSVIEHFAAIRWYQAGAVIPWERADPEVQARYRAKVTGGTP